MDTGPCTCWPTQWCAWTSSMRSVTRPFGRYEKKRDDEAEDRVLGDSAGARRGVRALHEKSTKTLSKSRRSATSCIGHEQTAGPVAQGDAGATRRDDTAWQPG